MMKNFNAFLIFIFLFSTQVLAKIEDHQEIKVLARISKQTSSFKTISPNKSQDIPFRLEDHDLEKTLKGLSLNEEALLVGHISQEKIRHQDKLVFRPIFVIKEIHPISLKELGKMKDFNIEPAPIELKSIASYAPRGLEVSNKTIGAITITASILLLKSLASSKSISTLNDKTENALIFSAGALATGAQIFEDLSGKK